MSGADVGLRRAAASSFPWIAGFGFIHKQYRLKRIRWGFALRRHGRGRFRAKQKPSLRDWARAFAAGIYGPDDVANQAKEFGTETSVISAEKFGIIR
jgi:hypothetical protein